MNNSYPNCQFAGLTYIGQCYCYPDLSHPERDQLQYCLDSALAELNCVKANKHTKQPNVSRAIKYIYINLNMLW
jgi:hypothetical protein